MSVNTGGDGQGVENVRDDGGACEGQGLNIEMQGDPKLSDIQIESVLTEVKGWISKEYTTEQCLKKNQRFCITYSFSFLI